MPHNLRQRDFIIDKINVLVSKNTHNFGIEVTNSIKHAKKIDLKNGDTLWFDGIAKNKYNLLVALNILKDNDSPPPGWTKSSGHWVFDVKMDFMKISIWVKDGNRTSDPETSIYAGIVSRKSICILFTYVALHEVDVTADDIKNAYLQAPTS